MRIGTTGSEQNDDGDDNDNGAGQGGDSDSDNGWGRGTQTGTTQHPPPHDNHDGEVDLLRPFRLRMCSRPFVAKREIGGMYSDGAKEVKSLGREELYVSNLFYQRIASCIMKMGTFDNKFGINLGSCRSARRYYCSRHIVRFIIGHNSRRISHAPFPNLFYFSLSLVQNLQYCGTCPR